MTHRSVEDPVVIGIIMYHQEARWLTWESMNRQSEVRLPSPVVCQEPVLVPRMVEGCCFKFIFHGHYLATLYVWSENCDVEPRLHTCGVRIAMSSRDSICEE